MHRPIVTRVLIAVELCLAAVTMIATWDLMKDPTGNSAGPLASFLLVGTPFDSYLVPAFILFLVGGAVPLGVALISAFRVPWARWAHLAFAAVLVAWTVVQSLLAGLMTANQIVFVGIGVVIAALVAIDFRAEKAEQLAAQADATEN